MGVRETKYYVASCDQCDTEVTSVLDANVIGFWGDLEKGGWHIQRIKGRTLIFCPACARAHEPVIPDQRSIE